MTYPPMQQWMNEWMYLIELNTTENNNESYILLKWTIRNTTEKLKREMKELELKICFQQKGMKGPTTWDEIETYQPQVVDQSRYSNAINWLS